MRQNMKPNIILEFDNVIVNSNKEIIRQLNNKYKTNKTEKDLKDKNYKSINKNLTEEELNNILNSEEFFNNLELNEGVLDFFNTYKDNYNFIIISKDSLLILDKIKKYVYKYLNKNIIVHQSNKKTIDFSSILFYVSDNTESLLSINSPIKILVKNYKNTILNTTPLNENNLYVINNFYDLYSMCEFDLILRDKGVFIGEK